MRELAPELRAVLDLARAAQGAYEVPELLTRICKSLADGFGFERAALSRYAAEANELEPVAAYGVPVEELQNLPRALEEYPFAQRAIERREAVFIADVSTDPVMPAEVAETFGVRSLLAIPLISEGRCLGVLTADRGGEPFELDEHQLDILTTIGVVAATFLEKALVHEELLAVGKLKSDFVALASHELRNPAAVIHGVASTLYARGEDLTTGQRDELRRMLYEHSERLTQLVEQLLDLSRLEANAVRIRPERFSVRRRVEELLALTGGGGRDVVSIDVPQELEVVADCNAFDRIASNLLVNALRYGRPPVIVSAEQRDRHFRLTVEDRGEGVAPQFVPHLFERFTRSDVPATEGTSGAGLGLSIAQSYARAHGGELLYEQASPHGARFQLVLPAS